MTKPLNVAMIGYGFMGRAHSNACRRVADFFDVPYRPELKVVCGRDREQANNFAKSWGYDDVETDWRVAIAREDIDVVDICVPNNLHREIAVAAAHEGKMVLCEKPLAMNLREAEEMTAAVESAGVPNMVWYNYRRIPAVTLAKQLADEGRLGRVFHFRSQFLQDWTMSPELPQGGAALWRLDSSAAGSGVTGDLLSHCIDTAMWLNGSISEVTAMSETFITERMHSEHGRMEPVEIDDACAFLARFSNGSLAIFESTRYARGHKALYTFEINGQDASIAWDLHDLHRLNYFDHRDDESIRGWRSIHVSDHSQPYMDKWWVPGLQIGYEHSFVHQLADFLLGLQEGRAVSPTFADALETTRVCDAVMASASDRKWHAIN